MALVNVTNVVVLDNPSNFLNPFQFEITFECLQELEEDLEWKVTYVGSATDYQKDQILDEILVGPVPVGTNKFVLQADPPDPSNLEEILGVTVVLVTCSYKERQFVQVGYYLNNEYTGEYDPEVGPPSSPDLSLVQRLILADKPRVTKFMIPWTSQEEENLKNNNNNNHNSSTNQVSTDNRKEEIMGTPSTAEGTDMEVE